MAWRHPPLNTGALCALGVGAEWMLLAFKWRESANAAFIALAAVMSAAFFWMGLRSWRKYGLWIKR